MANFANPTVGSNYTDFPGEIRASVDAALQQLSVGSHTNIPTGAIKFDTSANRWKKFNGSAFVDLTSTYDLNANVSVNQLNLGNDEKIRLGNSQDFEIFHQSSNNNSIIKETGGGIFSLQTNGSQISFFDIPNSSIMAEFNTGGACSFRHAGSPRLSTTSNGIQVTDRVGIGGSAGASLDVFGNIVQFGASNTTDQQFRLGRSGSGNRNAYIDIIGDNTYSTFGLRIVRNGTQGSNATSEINHRGTGNFRFICQDAGQFHFLTSNTTKAVITSAGRLGVGLTNPEVIIQTRDPGSIYALFGGNQNSDGNSAIRQIKLFTTGFRPSIQALQASGGSFSAVDLQLQPDGSNLMVGAPGAATAKLDVSRLGSVWTGQSPVGGTVAHFHNGNNVSTSPAYLGLGAGTSSISGIHFGDADDADVGRIHYSHNDNSLRFGTNASAEKMRIDSSGRLGIGTSSPNTKLDVRDGSATGISSRSTSTQETDSNKGLKVRNNSDTDTFSVSYKGQGYFAGKVGIGTTSPTTMLHVQQSAVTNAPSRSSVLYLENNANCEIQFVGNSSNDCQLRFGTSSNSFKGAIEYELDNNNLEFFTNGSERMRITSSGKVGIGTGTPAGKVHATSAANTATFIAQGEVDNPSYPAYGFSGQNADNGSRGAGMYLPADGTLAFSTHGSERLRITSGGKVGVGTNNPDQKLHVHKGSAGSASSDGNAVITAENNNHCIFQMLSPNNLSNRIMFGDPEDANAGELNYDHNVNSFLLKTNASERIRINSGGKVGISTSAPQILLDVGGSSSGGLAGLSNPVLYAGFTNNTSFGGVVLGAGNNGNTPFIAASKLSNGTGLNLAFNSFGAEVFRISQNALRIGQTSSDNPGQDNTTVGASIGKSGRFSSSTSGTITGINLNANTTSNSKHYISFRNSGTQIGSVTQNGASNVAYNTFSDKRVKENIAPLLDALTTLLKLKPVNYNYKADKEKKKFDGFIAQDLLEDKVCDYAATYIEREDWYGIDYSKLVTVAIAAIQELAGKVSDLEAKLG